MMRTQQRPPAGTPSRALITHGGIRLVLALVIATTLAGAPGCHRDEITAPGTDTLPPARPTGLRVDAAQDGYVVLHWNANTEADLRGYLLHRADGPVPAPFRIIDSTGGHDVIDTVDDYTQLYRYVVTAVDRDGNESAPSDTVATLSPNVDTPLAPDRLHVFAHNDADLWMELAWTIPPDVDIHHYRIFRSTGTSPRTDPGRHEFESPVPWYHDTTDLAINTRYHYAVTAVDRGALESDGAAEDDDMITGTPMLVSPADGARVPSWLTFHWRRVPGAVQYRIAVSTLPGAGELWHSTMADTGDETLQLMYAGPLLTLGRTYFWRVATITANTGVPNALSEPRMFQVME